MKKLLLILLLVCSAGYPQTKPHISDIRTFENLAALRASAPTATGTWAYTRGYSTSGDGGGGFWIYSPGSAAADNDGTIVAPTGYATGRWLRDMSSDSEYKIEWFGGSTSASDNSVALMNAVAAAGGRVVRFGKGTYAFTDTAVLASPTTGFNISGIEGNYPREAVLFAGINASVLRNNIATAGAAIINSTINPHYATRIANLGFVGSHAADGKVGLNIQKSFTQVTLENLSFRYLQYPLRVGYGEALSSVSGYYSIIRNISLIEVGDGIYFNALANGTHFDGIGANGVSATALKITQSADCKVSNSWFENTLLALEIDNTFSTIITNCYFEGALAIGQTQLQWYNSRSLVFENNNIRRSGNVPLNLELKNTDSVAIIRGNHFRIHSPEEKFEVRGVTALVASGTTDARRELSGKLIIEGNAFELDPPTTASATWYFLNENPPGGVYTSYCKNKILSHNTVNKVEGPNIVYSPGANYPTADTYNGFMVGTTLLGETPFELAAYSVDSAAATLPFSEISPSHMGTRTSFASGSLRLMSPTGVLFQINVDDSGTLSATSTLTTP